MARHKLHSANPRANMSLVSDHALATKPIDGAERKARERSDRERRRVYVAQLRWIKANLTAVEICDALTRLTPPIIVSVRTVERDFAVIRNDSRKYFAANRFDALFEISEAMARHKSIARTSTRRAMGNGADAARWARVAVLATEAVTTLLQDIGLIDRRIGTLVIDDDVPTTPIPSGAELARRWANVSVPDLVPKAEYSWKMGDAVESEKAANAATIGVSPSHPLK